ncbi:MAG: hypothetical protein HPY64_13915 [Anaerolineae bacterium]|nr:hypothetical protein [Anaerolineae bacterium]
MRRAIATGAALLWLALVLGLYYWVHKPLTPPLAEAIGGAILDAAVAALFALLAGGLGTRLLARLDLSFLSPAERLATTLLIGLGALALLILAVGAVSLSPLSMAALLLAVAALTRRETLTWAGDWQGLLRGGLPRDRWGRFLAFIALILLAIAFLLALLPPSMWDVLTYHLAGAAQHVLNSRFSAVEHNHFLGFSQLVDTLYAGQLALTGRLTGAALLHWIVGVGLLLAAGGYAARRSGPAAGWAAVGVLLAGRTIWLEMTYAYADLLPVALAVVAVSAAERWDEVRRAGELEGAETRRGVGYLLLVGAAAGLAMSTKYTVVWLGAALGLLVLWLARREAWRSVLSYGLLYGLVAAAILAPWLIRNALWYGNPFYPLLFDGGEMDAIRRAWYSQPGSGLIYGGGAWQLPLLPLTASVLGVEGAGTYNTDIGPLFVMLTPLLLLTRRQLTAAERATVRCALIVVGAVTVAWVLSAAFGSYISLQTRLVLYLFGPLAVVAGIALESLRRLPDKPLNLGFVVRAIVALALIFTVGDALRTLGRKGVQIYFSGEAGYRERYLEHALGWHYGAMRQVNTLPEGTTVRFLWEPRYLYCDGDRLNCWPDSLMDGWYYARRAVDDGSPAAIAAAWRATADYLLVYEFGRTFERENSILYTAADWAAWEDFVTGHLVEVWRGGNDGAAAQYILYRWRD